MNEVLVCHMLREITIQERVKHERQQTSAADFLQFKLFNFN